MTGSEAMDRLDYLNTCHEMGGYRIGDGEEQERQRLDSIFCAVGGRDGMEALTPAGMLETAGGKSGQTSKGETR